MAVKKQPLNIRQEIEAVNRYTESLLRCDAANIDVSPVQGLIESFNGDKEQLNKLCEDLSSIQTERETFKKLYRELQRSHDNVKELSSYQQESSQELDYGITFQKSMFEKVFGLRIKLTADKAISFEFQHLKPAPLDRTCSITLDVNSEGKWEVVQMEPKLSGVQALLDQLNETNNLAMFCKLIRLKFKEHIG